MNTEPPEGDDLQRMLVSMKQHVLEHATPHRRRRFRPGIALGIVGLLAIGTATGAVALTLSQQDEQPVAAPTQTQQLAPGPSATTPTSAPITEKPTPRPSATPVGNGTPTMPTDCRALVPAADYDRLFGDAPATRVVPVAEGLPADATPPPQSADEAAAFGTTEFYCFWKHPEADITGIAVTIGRGTPDQLAAQERGTYQGWSPTCTDEDGARTCRASKSDPEYSTDWARTMYFRGDTWVSIDQSNFPTDGLLPAIIETVWGD
jgi:hypothetical protein